MDKHHAKRAGVIFPSRFEKRLVHEIVAPFVAHALSDDREWIRPLFDHNGCNRYRRHLLAFAVEERRR